MMTHLSILLKTNLRMLLVRWTRESLRTPARAQTQSQVASPRWWRLVLLFNLIDELEGAGAALLRARCPVVVASPDQMVPQSSRQQYRV